MSKLVDIAGSRYGRLTVIKRVENYVSPKGCKKARWLCLCDCGKQHIATQNQLNRGIVKSCGCLKEEIARKQQQTLIKSGTAHPRFKHGGTVEHKQERLYRVWANIRKRCTNPNDKNYKHYGGRGISCCPEWDEYASFRDWAMASGYDPDAPKGQCTIDRIDVNGNYCPENCRWASQKDQMNNVRTNRKVLYEGRYYTAKQLAQKLGLPYQTVISRINRGLYEEEGETVCQE